MPPKKETGDESRETGFIQGTTCFTREDGQNEPSTSCSGAKAIDERKPGWLGEKVEIIAGVYKETSPIRPAPYG